MTPEIVGRVCFRELKKTLLSVKCLSVQNIFYRCHFDIPTRCLLFLCGFDFVIFHTSSTNGEIKPAKIPGNPEIGMVKVLLSCLTLHHYTLPLSLLLFMHAFLTTKLYFLHWKLCLFFSFVLPRKLAGQSCTTFADSKPCENRPFPNCF